MLNYKLARIADKERACPSASLIPWSALPLTHDFTGTRAQRPAYKGGSGLCLITPEHVRLPMDLPIQDKRTARSWRVADIMVRRWFDVSLHRGSG